MHNTTWLLPYTMSDEMKDKLINKLRKITGIPLNYAIEFVRYLNTDIDGKEHVVIKSANLDLDSIQDIYNLILPDFDKRSLRVQSYCKFRKMNGLQRSETLFTIATYLQAVGVRDKFEIVNRILLSLKL